MCTIKQTLAKTSLTHISTANPNLDGTGSFGQVLVTSGSISGMTINSITIKATGNTTEGMVRLFTGYIDENPVRFLYKEIYIPANTCSATVPTVCVVVNETLDLNPEHILYASTQNAEGFNIIVNAVSWTNGPCVDNTVCYSTKYIANTGIGTVSTANPNRDGSGTLANILTAGNDTLSSGTQVPAVSIKALGSNSEGMIRLFVSNGVNTRLYKEIPIPANTQTSVEPSYKTTIPLGLYLQKGYTLKASTQEADEFSIIAFATDYINPEFPEE